MVRRKPPIFMYVIIGLAFIGLLSFLTKEPSRLFMILATSAVIGFIIFFVARTLIRGESFSVSGDREEMRKYRQAVKQSQQRYKSYNQSNQYEQNKRIRNPKRTRRRPTHLTVIEGKKSIKKDDDRASN